MSDLDPNQAVAPRHLDQTSDLEPTHTELFG
jgi:hypothetical protein